MLELEFKNTGIFLGVKRKGKNMAVTYKELFWFEVENCDAFTVIDKIHNDLINSATSHEFNNNHNYTYLMYADGRYKIGCSQNIDKRLKSMQTASPHIKLIAFTNKFGERLIQSIFKDFKIKGEWFKFSEIDLKLLQWIFDDKINEDFKHVARIYSHYLIKPFINKSPSIKEERYLKYRLPFGKYKGFFLHQMTSADTVGYVEWLKIKDGKKQGNFFNILEYHTNRLKEENRYPIFNNHLV